MSEAAATNTATTNTNDASTKPGDKTLGAGAPPASTTTDNKDTFTKVELDAAVARALQEVQEKAKKDARDASLNEQEKLRQRAEEAEAQSRTLRAKDALIEAATTAKAKSPTKIYRLYQNDLLFDDKGQPTNIAALIAQAKKDFADEFGTGTGRGSADAGAGGDATTTSSSMNDIIRRKAGY